MLPPTLQSATRRALPWGVLIGLLAICALNLGAWVDRNGLMDGFQNEAIHVTNAMDLWWAWVEGDDYTLRQIALTYYWPPGFYAWPAALYRFMGVNHAAMVTANLGHLAVLLLAVYGLGSALSDRAGGALAAAIVVIYPSILGNLVRFEPNVAVTAWVSVGTLCLLRSRGFADRRWSLLFGLACGVGLLMDRLSLAVFLALPAAALALTGLRRPDRGARAAKALGALALILAVAGWWLVCFYHFNRAELLAQGGVGEIDAAGTWTEQRDPTALATWLYYGTVLLDEQAGLVPGLAALVGLAAALGDRVTRRRRLVPALVLLTGLGLFTLVQKKQVYYTVPVLGCAAALTAAWLRSVRGGWLLAAAVLLSGVHQIGWRLWGRGLPLPAPAATLLGGYVLPESWTDRRHPQASPPRHRALPIDAMAQAVGPGEIIVLSEDPAWPEQFVGLQLRERLPGWRVRGLTGDPSGTYEWARTAGNLVYVTAADGAWDWPTQAAMEAALRGDNYTLSALPPVAELIAELAPRFGLAGRWALPGGGTALLFRIR